MSVCVRKADNKIFVQYMVDGVRRRKYFKGTGPLVMAAAEAFNASVVQTIDRLMTSPTITELVNEYMTMKQPKMSPVSFHNLLLKMERVILPALGDFMAINLPLKILDNYVATRSKTVKMTTIHRELSDLRAVLNFAVRRKLISHSPLKDFDFPERDDTDIQPISHEELVRLVRVSPPHIQRVMLISFYIGLRPGAVELLSITYSQVNWSAMTITVVSAKKGNKQKTREIPINQDLPLRAWYEEDGAKDDMHIIQWKGKPISSFKSAFKTAKKKAGLSNRKIPPYSIRHAFVTTLLKSGVDPYTVANMAGHDVETMLKYYASTSGDTKIAAIGKLPQLMFDAMGDEIEGE
jgi:integrase